MANGSTTATAEKRGEPANRVQRRYTYSELCAELPKTNQPAELWDGELIMSPSPSFRHQKIVLNFYRQLHGWVSGHDLGEVITSPIDMVLSPHRVMQPDVVYIAKERLHLIERVIMGAADLVAEIISLGDRTRDRIEKRDLYEQYGVKEYWLIDSESQSVDVLSIENGAYRLVVRAQPGETVHSRLLPGFSVDVRALFSA